MAERSTAAVDVAGTGGNDGQEETIASAKRASEAPERPKATADGKTPQHSDGTSGTSGKAGKAAKAGKAGGAKSSSSATSSLSAPELHSGHKLARRYRLEECTTRLDGFSSWRAVDEKLRRAVGVHLLPAGHARARDVLAAARSSALLGDPRFVQILDAVENDDLVYIVHEWLPDAVPLTEVFAAGPLEPYESYQLVTQVAQAMAAAHREGLAHLRLTPGAVLRTGTGQYRIRGLAVNAALRGISADSPERTDTEAIGALLYAALTGRWPYEEDAYGLTGMANLAGGSLLPPDQVRAGIHRGLSELTMRALVNRGATAASQEQPCVTPQELVTAVAALPRIKPPEPEYPASYSHAGYAGYQRGNGYQAQAARPQPGRTAPTTQVPTPPTLPGRTGKALKWGVSALLIAALGLGSWQVADALMNGGDGTQDNPPETKQSQSQAPAARDSKPVSIAGTGILDPQGTGRESTKNAANAYDGDPESYWQTLRYASSSFGSLKEGVGLILDLGGVKQVNAVKVGFKGQTSVDFLAAPKTTGSMPSSLGDFSKVSSGKGSDVNLKAEKPIETRYVLVWITELPLTENGEYRGRISEVQVLG